MLCAWSRPESAPKYSFACRYARSVPAVCPLAETKHPLYPVGSSGQHLISKYTSIPNSFLLKNIAGAGPLIYRG